MIQAISDALVKVKSGCRNDGEGRVCNYYKISENVGTKVYVTKRECNLNMTAQRSLYSLGHAPEVLSDMVSFKDNGVKRYMFLTEVATTVFHVLLDDGLVCEECYNHSCCSNLGTDWYELEQFQDIVELRNALKEDGLLDQDLHWGNYGYLSNGNPVVLDCEFYHLGY